MELKYKVWDKEIKTIIPLTELIEKLLNSSTRNFKTEAITNSCIIDIITILKGYKSGGIELLPYTGVKDINKKESYLGDILKNPLSEWSSSKDKEKAANSFGVVKKEDNSNNMFIEWNFKRKMDGEYYWDSNELPITHIREYEIKGNIFKNEDMIEKEV